MQSTATHPPRNSHTRDGASLISTLAVLVLAGVGIYLAGSAMGWKIPGTSKGAGPRIITHTVKRDTFVFDAVERGEVESYDNVEVRCEVKAKKGSEIAILEVVPEGSMVKKGDVLVQLDVAALEQELIEQQIACNSKEAEMISAKNTYQAAEISLEEYEKGTFEQEEQEAQAAEFLAQEALRRAKEYLAYSERLSARGYVTPQQLDGDRFALEKARTELAASKTKLGVLQEYTKPKQMLSLNSDVRSAKADWDSNQSSYELELRKLADLKTEIAKCTILAPEDGQAIHANQASSRSSNEFIVEAGANVREGQVIIRMPKSERMQVKAKVNETRVTMLKEGLEATVRIDAFGDRAFRGKVTHVNEYPEATSFFGSQAKEYATEIQIVDQVQDLRSGLTAEVTIHVSRVENAILVPMQCIYERNRQTWCFRRNGEIDWEAVEVEVAQNNDKFVMLSKGLDDGDVVAMNPAALADQMDLPEPEGAASSREALGGGQADANPGGPGRDTGGSPPGVGGRPPETGGGRPDGAGGGKPDGAGGGKPAGAGGGRPAGAGGGRPAGAGGGGPSGRPQSESR